MNREVGEKVRVKLLKDLQAMFDVKKCLQLPSGVYFTERMEIFCGKIVTIKGIRKCISHDDRYHIEEDSGEWAWTDEMFESIKSKQAIFHLRRVMVGDEECYKLLGWENVQVYEKLPGEYLTGHPHFSLTTRNVITFTVILWNNGNYINLHIGDCFRKIEWEESIKPALKQAGKRLSLILKKKNGRGKLKLEKGEKQ